MNKFFKGQLLVELVLVIGLSALIIPALLTGLVASREGKPQQEQRVQGIALMKETDVAVRSVKDTDWTTFAGLTVGSPYHPAIVSNKWSLVSGLATTSAGLTQKVVIANVYRTSTGAITSNPIGNTLDPSTKQADITISWTKPTASFVTSTIYVTRTTNVSYSQTSTADFNAGTLASVQVTATGEVKLESNKAKWCSPSFSSATIDLPDGPPVAVAATASASTSTPNDVFAAVAPTASTSTKLAYVTVSANNDPPVATLKGTFTLDSSKYSSGTYPSSLGGLTNTFKTNDVKYYKSASGKVYALMATDLTDHEVVAVQINNGSGDSYQDPVNKIYKYWTYFNTRIFNAAAGLNTGFLSPSANSPESSSAGDNNGYDSNPTRAYSNDASFAVDTNSGSNTGTNCTGTDKDKHRFYNYGFSIPSGATINGIEVRLDSKVDSVTGAPKHCVQLSWDGGTNWTTAQSTSTLTTGEVTYSLGGAADTWGRTWSDTNFSNGNFRVRVIDVASNNSRDFSLDWVAVRVNYSGGAIGNDQAPFDYGARSISVLGDTGYVASGGYLYAFDLASIDSKTPTAQLDQIGCRIELDGYDCKPGTTASDLKYNAGETGTTWSNVGSPAHNDCSDGGNIELYADNHIASVQVGANKYVYVAVGAGTNAEFNIVNATSVPDINSSPAINASTCGSTASGNASWKMAGSLDFNSKSNTEEAANSVFAKSDGTRAYISSNGGIDGNGDGTPDSKQFYILNTTSKTSPSFLTGVPGSPNYGPLTGYYYGTGANAQLYPRRSLTVLNGQRAVLVGKDGTDLDGNDAEEYQVLDMSTSPNSESSPGYCGGLNYNSGFNDLTSVSEADGDNFVYMVANTASYELKIIQGGPDQQYVESGTFLSSIYDASYSAAFNRFVATVDQPGNSSIKMQVAVAPPVSGSCNGVNPYPFLGPDKTSSSYFLVNGASISAQVPFGNYLSNTYQNPERCFRYKAWLNSTSDYNQTPVLYDMTWNYSL